jgi:WD40 repeat protein
VRLTRRPPGPYYRGVHPETPDLFTAAAAPPGEGDPAILAHLRACRACGELLRLAGLGPGPEASEDAGGQRARYVDWRPLHASAMGRIFAARDTRLGRDVALKLPPSAADCPDPAWRAELRLRFENEARLAARLDHPAIVAIHETGHFADGEPYFTMQLIRGVPIDRALADRPRLADRLALLGHVAAAAEAVAYAHARGIVHRDLKPANLMVGPFGETVVIDWGLSRDIGTPASPGGDGPDTPEAPGELTRVGVGTPHYMPPEQALGAPADPRMDLYALGATLYHLVAGVPPYGAAAAAGLVRARLAAGPPPPLRALCPEAPRALVDIAERCMERRPEDRYPDALEVARELRRFSSGELTRTRPPTAGEWLRHWMGRHRTVLALSAAFSVVLAAGGLLAVHRIVEERDAALNARVAAEANERAARTERARALGHLAGRWATVPARRLSALAAGVAAVSDGLSSGEAPTAEAMAGLIEALAVGPALRALTGPGGELTGMGFSPDGAIAVGVAAGGALRVWRVADGQVLATDVGLPARPYGLRFSPDGRHFAAWGPAPEVLLYSTSAPGAPARLLTGFTTPVHNVAFSADGAGLAAITVAGEVGRWSTADARRLTQVSLGPANATVALTRDGEIFVGRGDGEIVRVRSGAAALRWRAHESELFWSRLSADDRILYSASAAASIQAWRLDPPREPGRPPIAETILEPIPGRTLNGVRASASGSKLAAGLTDGAAFIDPTTGEATVGITGFGFTDQFNAAGDLFLTPDYGAGGCVGLDPDDGRSRFRLPVDSPGPRQECAPSPDGARALWADAGPDPLLFDAERSLAAGMLDGFSGAVLALGPCGADLCGVAADGHFRRWSLPEGRSSSRRALGGEPTAVVPGPDTWWIALADGDTLAIRGDSTERFPGAGPVAALGLCPPTSIRPPLRLDLDGSLRALQAGAPPRRLELPFIGRALACGPDEVVVASAEGALHRPAGLAGPRVAWPAVPGSPAGVRALALDPVTDRLMIGRSNGTTLVLARIGSPVTHPGRLVTPLPGGVVTAGDDGALSFGVGTDRHTVAAHATAIVAHAFEPDAGLLATAAADGGLRLSTLPDLGAGWSLPGRRATSVTALAFVAGPTGGPVLVSGGADGGVRAWPVSAADAVRAACRRLSVLGFPADSTADARSACATARPPVP